MKVKANKMTKISQQNYCCECKREAFVVLFTSEFNCSSDYCFEVLLSAFEDFFIISDKFCSSEFGHYLTKNKCDFKF